MSFPALDRRIPQPFNTEELLKLIQKLVAIDSRWIPSGKGYSLYLRPTFIGTRSCKYSYIFVSLEVIHKSFPSPRSQSIGLR